MASVIIPYCTGFDALAALAEQRLHEMMNASPVVKQIFYRKHFFATLPEAEGLYIGSRPSEQSRTSYGSSYFYFLLIKRAISQLIRDHKGPKTSWSFRVLCAWKSSMRAYQKLAAIDNYFRARVPGNVDRIAQGRDPITEIPSPSSEELSLIAGYIVDQIKKLPKKGMLAIPMGRVDHETVGAIWKSDTGKLVLINSDGYWVFIPHNPADLLSRRWWETLLVGKYSTHGMNLAERADMDHMKTGYLSWENYGLSRRPVGGGETCYANCQWEFLHNLFRHYTSNKTPSSIARIARLTTQIRERLCADTTAPHPELVRFTKRAIEVGYLATLVEGSVECYESQLRAAIQSVTTPLTDRDFLAGETEVAPDKYFDFNFVYDEMIRKEYTDYQLPVTESVRKECRESTLFQIRRRLFRVAMLNFPAVGSYLSHDAQSPLFKYLQQSFEQNRDLDASFVRRVKTTIEILETANEDCLVRGLKSVVNWVGTRTRVGSHPLCLDIFARLQGVNTHAFKEALMNRDPKDFFRCLEGPDEVIEWVPRLLEVLRREEMLQTEFERYELAARDYLP